MEKQSHLVYLALGSNLGNRLTAINSAVTLLRTKIDNMKISKIYETEPWGIVDQPAFLNACIEGNTVLSPEELIKFVKGIEVQLGRKSRLKWGPREIDVDIIFYEDLILDQPNLVIPHPFVQERAFVLAPLADLAPNFIHPVLKRTIKQILRQESEEGVTEFRGQLPGQDS